MLLNQFSKGSTSFRAWRSSSEPVLENWEGREAYRVYSPIREDYEPSWLSGGYNPTTRKILLWRVIQSNELSPLYNEQIQDLLTSAEDYAQDGLIRLCSTSHIIWLDSRYPGKPLLSYKHHRQYDRTLQTSTIFLDGPRKLSIILPVRAVLIPGFTTFL